MESELSNREPSKIKALKVLKESLNCQDEQQSEFSAPILVNSGME